MTVFLLDQIQKGKEISDCDLASLQEKKLIRVEDHHIYLIDRIPENDHIDETGRDDKGTETKTGTEMDGQTGTETKTGTEMDSRTGTEMKTGTEMDSRTGTEMKTGTEMDSRTGTEMKTGTEMDSQTGTEMKTGTEIDNRSGAEIVQNAKTDDVHLTLSEIQVLQLIRNHPSMTLIDMASEMDFSVNGIRYILNNLRDKGLVVREGSQKKGKWIVVHSDPKPTAEPDDFLE